MKKILKKLITDKMKKICVIGIGASGCDIVRILEKNYKFDDNIKIIGSDSAICEMRDCKNVYRRIY